MKTYIELEKYFEEKVKDAKKGSKRSEGQALTEQGYFYYYCGINLWSFELNRPPFIESAPTPLEWKESEDFYTFFGTLPKDLTFKDLFEKAEGIYKNAISLFETVSEDENYPNLFGKTNKEQAEIMASFIDIRKQKADAFMRLIMISDYLDKTKEEINFVMDNAEKFYKELADRGGLASVLMQRAYRERYRTYDMEKTRKYLEEAIVLFRETGGHTEVASCLSKIADTYHPAGMGANLELWEKYNNEAIDSFKRGFDLENALILTCSMIDYFEEIKDKEKVVGYTAKAKALNTKKTSWPFA